MVEYFKQLENALNIVAGCINRAIDETEREQNYKFSLDEKKVCVGFALLYLFTKYGK